MESSRLFTLWSPKVVNQGKWNNIEVQIPHALSAVKVLWNCVCWSLSSSCYGMFVAVQRANLYDTTFLASKFHQIIKSSYLASKGSIYCLEIRSKKFVSKLAIIPMQITSPVLTRWIGRGYY